MGRERWEAHWDKMNDEEDRY